MTIWLRPLLAGLIVLLCSCAATSSATPAEAPLGSSAQSVAIGDLDRSYRLYLPADLPAAAPLVVMLHGGLGSAAQAESTYGWNELAERAKFVVAYPDGFGRTWNAGGGCCGRAARDGVDDVAFVSAVVDDVRGKVGIDGQRVYATGISNGGMMSYALACHTPIFAAIGPDAATQLVDCPSPRPTSVLHIHGTADTSVRYDGAPGDGLARIDGPSVPDVNAFWRNVDRCDAPSTTTDGPVTTLSARCADGRAVELITIDGAGHQWPGSAPVRRRADTPYAGLAATARFWQFFAAHPA